jgi:hypothetical protein
LLIPDFECDHTAHAHVDKLISCCEIKPIKHEGEKCGESDCCDTYSFVVKLDITIDNQKISKNASFDVHAGLLENDTEINYTDSEEKHIIISNDLPPPLSGKDLHIYLNQLNIPCLSV